MNRRTQAPLTIGIYGAWGSGKSSFLAQLAKRLPKQHPVANFNPWRLSGGGEVWAGLVNEIAPIIDRHLGPLQRIRFLWNRDSTRSVSKLHTRLVAASKKAGNWLTLATATGGFLAAGHLKSVQPPDFITNYLAGPGWLATKSRVALEWLGAQNLADVKWDLVASLTAAAILAAFIFVKIAGTLWRPFSTQFKANLSQFKNTQDLKNATFKDFEALRKVIGDFTAQRANSHKPYIVLLIDDLDRCSPDRVVGVLEAVNSFVAELPIITVFAIDTKFVCSAVAARYRFLFATDDTREAREQYGRLFLEKIIHVPFQLTSIRSYELYVRELLSISDNADAEEKNSKPRDSVPMPGFRQLLKGDSWQRLVWSLPLLVLIKTLTCGTIVLGPEQRRSAGFALTFLFGAEYSPEQQEWLSNQDYPTQVFYNAQASQTRGRFLLWNYLTAVSMAQRSRQQALSTTIKIQESDRDILRSHIANLRGDPRSIKRFVNTFLLAKGISALAAAGKTDDVLMEDLAAWLVLLQNWPREGSILCGSARTSDTESFFSNGWAQRILGGHGPPDMIAFIDVNREKLDRLALSHRGLDIARCFSFFTTDTRQAA